MNGRAALGVRVLDKHAVHELIVEQSLAIDELVQHPRGDQVGELA